MGDPDGNEPKEAEGQAEGDAGEQREPEAVAAAAPHVAAAAPEESEPASSKKKLVEHVTNPNFYLLPLLAVLGVAAYGLYIANQHIVAQEVARLLVDRDNFFEKNDTLAGRKNVPSPLDDRIDEKIRASLQSSATQQLFSRTILETLSDPESVEAKQDIARFVVSGWLEMDPEEEANAQLQERLRERIRRIVNEEIVMLRAMQDEYGRVDSLFRNTVVFDPLLESEDGDHGGLERSLAKDINFFAHKNQRVLILVSGRFYFTRPNGAEGTQPFGRFFVKGTHREDEIGNNTWEDITDNTFGVSDGSDECTQEQLPNYAGILPQIISLRPDPTTPLGLGERIEADVTIIVQNGLDRAICGDVVAEGGLSDL